MSFSWRDYADGGARKVMMLRAMESLRRFLLRFARQFRGWGP